MEAGVADMPMLGWMSALADATRARLLRLVERHELAVADLCAVLQLPQSTVSRHLKILADDEWVTVRQDGTSRLYRMASSELDPAARRLWALLREQTAHTPAIAQDDQRLAAILRERQSRSQAFFSSSAGQWDRLRQGMFGDKFHLLALPALLDDPGTVADLGCGTGQMAEALAPFVGKVIAVDRSRAMLRAAGQRLAAHPNVELRQGELAALPIDDDALDVATLSLVLHHQAEPIEILREAARVLRPGGRLLVIDMLAHDRQEYQQEMGHVWLGFEQTQVAQWFADAGLEHVQVRPLPPAPDGTGPGLFAAAGRRAGGPEHNGRGGTPTRRIR